MPRHVTTRSGKVVDLDHLREARQGVRDAKRRARRDAALDLSTDGAIAALVARRTDLKEIEQAGKDAEAERKAIDAQIIMKLGNADAALGPDGMLISAPTVRRDEFVMPATTYRYVKVEMDRR
jgi:hypothetical protein